MHPKDKSDKKDICGPIYHIKCRGHDDEHCPMDYTGQFKCQGFVHEQSYTFVNSIVNKSYSRRTIVLHYNVNQSKSTNDIALYATVHETDPRDRFMKVVYIRI